MEAGFEAVCQNREMDKWETPPEMRWAKKECTEIDAGVNGDGQNFFAPRPKNEWVCLCGYHTKPKPQAKVIARTPAPVARITPRNPYARGVQPKRYSPLQRKASTTIATS